jgi:hypothetical protein
MVYLVAVKPCLRAFWAERALPDAVTGPVDYWELRRLAASCFSEIGFGINGNGRPLAGCYRGIMAVWYDLGVVL